MQLHIQMGIIQQINKKEKEFKDKHNLFAKYLILDINSYVELHEALSQLDNDEDEEKPDILDMDNIYYEGLYNTYIIASVQTIDEVLIELR